jgi:hypothetical protein
MGSKAKREEVGGFELEKSVCGWWVIDPFDRERSWLFSTKSAAVHFVFNVLGGM